MRTERAVKQECATDALRAAILEDLPPKTKFVICSAIDNQPPRKMYFAMCNGVRSHEKRQAILEAIATAQVRAHDGLLTFSQGFQPFGKSSRNHQEDVQ